MDRMIRAFSVAYPRQIILHQSLELFQGQQDKFRKRTICAYLSRMRIRSFAREFADAAARGTRYARHWNGRSSERLVGSGREHLSRMCCCWIGICPVRL